MISPRVRPVVLAVLALASGCTQMLGSNSGGVPKTAEDGARRLQTAAGRLVGPGQILTAKFSGPIFGWSIDENGTDGVLTQVSSLSIPFTSYVETFNQTTGEIVKIVREEKSGPQGSRELVADSILANDVDLIDNERPSSRSVHRRNVYYLMAPVTGNKINGYWTPPPPGNDFKIWDIADQQVDPDAVMATTTTPVLSQPPIFAVVVADVAKNKILRTLHQPRRDGVNYPYFVAEDTTTHHAYVPAANYHSQTVFVDFNLSTGSISNDFVAPPFSGPVHGMAIDSATHMMCTTTGTTYSVQMYNLTTKKQTFVGQIPNSGGEGQAGTLIAADPVNHLFLVEQPNSLLGGSEVYVYDEHGNVLESLAGFQFASYNLTESGGIQVVAKTRSGYVPGPNANQLTSFTY